MFRKNFLLVFFFAFQESRHTNDKSSSIKLLRFEYLKLVFVFYCIEIRSISMPRSEEIDDYYHSNKKHNSHLNINNSNNNLTSTRVATIKSAKRDHKPPLNVNFTQKKSILLIYI